MKAIVKVEAGFGACYQDVPEPTIGPGDVLVQVRATSFCGTDLHIYRWSDWAASRIKTPLVFGHEVAGEVIEVGSAVQHVCVGDHVAAESHLPCGQCYQCHHGEMHICQNLRALGVDRDGGFAEYVAIPEICAIKTDPSLPWNIATMQEPFGNSVYSVDAADVRGKRVIIFGDGPTGVFALAMARVRGAAEVICVGAQAYRMDMLRAYKPDHLLDARECDPAAWVMDHTRGAGVDVALEMSGAAPAIKASVRSVRKGGRVVVFGIPGTPVPIDIGNDLIFREVHLRPVYGRRMFETWDAVQDVLLTNAIDLSPVVTHEFAMRDIDQAMELLMGEEKRAGKIVLVP